jgi:hypothetical protein
MKKHLLLLIIIMGTGYLHSQIVITNNDLVGTGSTAMMALDTMPDGSIVPGPDGPNQTWDFSALQEDFLDTTKFVNPAWTPYGQLFPESNFAIQQFGVDNLYVMMYRDDSELSVVGMVMSFYEEADTTIIIHMNPSQKVAEFPVAYGNSRKDTSRYQFTMPGPTPPVDSFRMQFTTHADINVDAWGMARIPMGNFEALRIHEHRIQFDCTFIKMAGQWIFQAEEVDTSDMYTWWSNDNQTGFYMVEMSVSNGDVETVQFLKQTPTQGVNEDPEKVLFPVYPNPAGSYVVIETDPDFKGTIEIRNMNGFLCKTIAINGPRKQRIGLDELPSGIYLYTVRDDQNKSTYSGKFVKR